MRYTNAAHPVVGILDESTLKRFIHQLQYQCPALFNIATPGFFGPLALGANPPRLVLPIPCAQKVLEAVWKDPAALEMSYLALRFDPATLDLSKLPDSTAEALKTMEICVQVDSIKVNFYPFEKADDLAFSLQPFMEPQCVALQVHMWVGMLRRPEGNFTYRQELAYTFPLELQAVGRVNLLKAEAGLVVDVALRAVEIMGLQPAGITSMIKYLLLRVAADQITRRQPELKIPADLLSIDLVKDLLYKKDEDPNADRPSIILRVSFGAQIMPAGPGSPEIDQNRVRIVLVPDALREEVL